MFKHLLVVLGICICALVPASYSQDCSVDEFLCPETGVCIPGNMVCDGFADCVGGADELNCTFPTTTPCPGFTCPGSELCIPEAWVCDGDNDCGDESDEQNCPPTPCPGFLCDNGKCIRLGYVCDGYDDCGDGSDEDARHSCPPTTTTTTTPCSGFVCADTGRCIPGNWQCDGYRDCSDGSDEEGCATTVCPGFNCHNTGMCILPPRVCDGKNDCGDFSDETEEACPCAEDEFRCKQLPGSIAPGMCIPQRLVCDEDGIWDCPDGSDEENCTRTKPLRTRTI